MKDPKELKTSYIKQQLKKLEEENNNLYDYLINSDQEKISTKGTLEDKADRKRDKVLKRIEELENELIKRGVKNGL